jgi:hypothetical protein
MRAYVRYESISQAQKAQQRSLTGQRIVAFDGPIPSFLDQEYQYIKQASSNFPELITPAIHPAVLYKGLLKSYFECLETTTVWTL